MANTIRLKRGSGSDPSASDLVVGELAVRTDSGKIFTKKDNGSVAEISGGGGIDDGDKGDVTVSNGGDTFTINNDAVTLAKMQNVITDTILGRTTNGTGNLEVLSAASVRGIINVEDGATADQTASEILTLIKTVDGAGSGLDADTLDGISSASFLRSDTNTLLNGILTIGGSSVSGGEGGEFRMTYAPNGSLSGSNLTVDVNNNNFRIFEDGGNNRGVFIDLTTCSNSASGKLYHNGNDGSGSGLDADLLDGQEGSYYRNADNINAGTLASARIENDAVTFAKMQNISQDRLIGRTASGSGDATDLTAAQARALLNVENGATADQTASEILTLIKTVDGSGSGLDADTLDGAQGSQFLRSDASDTFSEVLTLSKDATDVINFSASSTNDSRGIAFNSRTALSADASDGWLRLNQGQEFGNGVYTPLKIRADGGIQVDGAFVIDASGNIVASKVPTLNQNTTGSSASCTGNAATATQLQNARTIAGTSFNGTANINISYNNLTNKPTIPTNNNQLTNGAGYITSASFSDVAGGGTFSGDIAVNGGAGALTVNGNSDIRFNSGSWTGNAYGKIQHHGTSLYISGGSSGDYSFIFRHNANDRVYIKSNGTIYPQANNSSDLGTSSKRWANLYVQDMHFSNGEDNPNKVDGTWGDWTLQEGEDQIYMLNNRNGKKYKMNLTEIV